MHLQVTVTSQAIQADATVPQGTLLTQLSNIVHDVLPEAEVTLQTGYNVTSNATNGTATTTTGNRRSRRLADYTVPPSGAVDCSDAQSFEYLIFVLGEVLNATLLDQLRAELQARVAEVQTAVGADGLCTMSDDNSSYLIVHAPPPPLPLTPAAAGYSAVAVC